MSIAFVRAWVLVGSWLLVGVLALEKGSREAKLFKITPPPPIKNTGIGIKSGKSQS